MTNEQAVELVVALVRDFEREIGAGADDKRLRQVLAERLLGWAVIRPLSGVAEIVAKSWLERRPGSELARETLINHLYLAGQPAEAAALEDGAPPEPLDEASEKMVAWSRANAQRSADFGD